MRSHDPSGLTEASYTGDHHPSGLGEASYSGDHHPSGLEEAGYSRSPSYSHFPGDSRFP